MSASSILSRLRHKGQITEEEYRKLMNIKNSERHTQKVIEDIKSEIAEYKDDKVIHAEINEMVDIVLQIIDKYK